MPACSFIYFDAGFTLLRPSPSVGFHYAARAAAHGFAADAAALDANFLRAWKVCRARQNSPLPHGADLPEARAFWTKVVRECFLLAGATPPDRPAYYDEVFELFADASAWALYDDVEAALGVLDARGIPYGVLSNWDLRLRSILRGMGLLPRLASLVLSCEVGAEKPSPVIFEAALRATGLSDPAALGMIGDEPEADGHGALRAGWRQCLVLRDSPAAAPPLSSARGLPEVISTLL